MRNTGELIDFALLSTLFHIPPNPRISMVTYQIQAAKQVRFELIMVEHMVEISHRVISHRVNLGVSRFLIPGGFLEGTEYKNGLADLC